MLLHSASLHRCRSQHLMRNCRFHPHCHPQHCSPRCIYVPRHFPPPLTSMAVRLVPQFAENVGWTLRLVRRLRSVFGPLPPLPQRLRRRRAAGGSIVLAAVAALVVNVSVEAVQSIAGISIDFRPPRILGALLVGLLAYNRTPVTVRCIGVEHLVEFLLGEHLRFAHELSK